MPVHITLTGGPADGKMVSLPYLPQYYYIALPPKHKHLFNPDPLTALRIRKAIYTRRPYPTHHTTHTPPRPHAYDFNGIEE